jgi:hypothetical protein
MKTNSNKFSAGDWVEVRSKEEILRTLDSHGRLDGMPFMPEMFSFCGQRFRVHKRAHKTCDTVFPVRGRRLDRAVHLDTRCDGSAHGGCDAGCLIFWKEAWLKPAVHISAAALSQIEAQPAKTPGLSVEERRESDVWTGTRSCGPDGQVSRYYCQATQLPYATSHLDWWDIRQYAEDFSSGNVGLWRLLCGLVYSIYYNLSRIGIGLGPAMHWFYDQFHFLWRGTAFPRKKGSIPEGQPTPAAALHLQPGELVRVKTHAEILQTLTTGGRNRGMGWDAEMVPYCGQTHRVLKRVNRIVDEKSGRMQELKTPAIILDSVVCQSRYSECRMFCPRGIYQYWREIWLERTGPDPSLDPVTGPCTSMRVHENAPDRCSGSEDAVSVECHPR